tara:strand:+ start:16294 stop:17352 length:1059 start_codon:yes stop_codon:yes gene_type:complete
MSTLVEEVLAEYPWAQGIGVADLIMESVINGDTLDMIVQTVRTSEPYRRMFPAMDFKVFRDERDYLDRVEDYRTVLKQAGFYNPSTDDPQDYVGFIQGGIDAEELRTRVTTYKQLEEGSQEMRDQFYIYAGMDVSVDDLFEAVINPSFGQALVEEYEAVVQGSNLDYQTFIERATERGLDNVATLLEGMVDQGLTTREAVSRVRSIDPTFAREIMGVIANTGDVSLNYDELSYAFQYALIGSAASEQGLQAPDREMVERLQQAGVDRARAMQAYGRFASGQGAIQGMVQRATQGEVEEFTQADFEEGVLLGQSDKVDMLQRAQAMEEAYARRGGFATQQEGRRFTQRGRTGY